MQLNELIKERYSLRSYSDKPIEPKKLELVLEAARFAPSAKNMQPHRIFVLKSPEAVEKMRSLTRNAFDAPVIMLVCADKGESWVNPFTQHKSYELDAGIAVGQMMLQARELGLGTVCACYLDMDKIAQAFCLPENYEIICILPVGYPSDTAAPSPLHPQRKPLEETTTEL